MERFDGLGRGLYRWAALGYEHSAGESQQLLVFIHTGYLLRLGSSGSFVTPLSLAHMGNELFHFPQVSCLVLVTSVSTSTRHIHLGLLHSFRASSEPPQTVTGVVVKVRAAAVMMTAEIVTTETVS